jgi:hypothetical protein
MSFCDSVRPGARPPLRSRSLLRRQYAEKGHGMWSGSLTSAAVLTFAWVCWWGNIICPRYSSWVLLAARAVGTLTGTPVAKDTQVIIMELELSSQSSCQAFSISPACLPQIPCLLRSQRAIMHSLLPDASCRNRRGAVISCQMPALGASRSKPDMYSQALEWTCHDPPPSHDHCIPVVPTQPSRSDNAPPPNFMQLKDGQLSILSLYSVRDIGQLRGLIQLHSTDKAICHLRSLLLHPAQLRNSILKTGKRCSGIQVADVHL